jgi:hypothetical protein
MSKDINKNNQSIEKNIEAGVEYMSNVTHSAVVGAIVKSVLGLVAFICVGYYSMWLSNNYVKRETFEAYTSKQDQLLSSRFDAIQSKLEIIINKQTISTEQFKNFSFVLDTQQKSIDNLNDRITFMERSVYKTPAQTSK